MAGRSFYQDLFLFTSKLSDLLSYRMPLDAAIESIIRDELTSYGSKYSKLRSPLVSVLEDVRAGRQLSDGLDHHPGVFPEFYRKLVRSGESSGNLIEALDQAKGFLRIKHEFTTSFFETITYSLIVFFVFFNIGAYLSANIIPMFVGIFDSTGVPLPPTTRMLSAMFKWANLYLPVVWLLSIAAAIFVVFVYRECGIPSVLGRLAKHFGPMFRLVQLYEYIVFSKMMSLLLRSGMPMTSALGVTSRALTNPLFSNVVHWAAEKPSDSLAKSLAAKNIFDSTFLWMINIGERSEDLPAILSMMGSFYSEELHHYVKRMMKVIQIIFTLIAGILTGMLLLGVFLPMVHLIMHLISNLGC